MERKTGQQQKKEEMLFKRYQTAAFSTDIITPCPFQNIYGLQAKNVKIKHTDSTSGAN